MVRMIKAAGASVVLATLPPVWQSEEKVAERNRIIKAVAADEKVLLADLNAALEEAVKSAGGLDSRKAWERYYLWADDDEGVHPNSLGYTVLAGKWFKALEAAVEGAADAPASD
jgi:lysophospholipase L1-like esterase